MKIFIEISEAGCDFSELLSEQLEKLKKGSYEITIKKAQRNRTLAENKYYWGVIIGSREKEVGLSFFLGMESQDMHDVLAEKFLTTKKRVMTDRRKKIKFTRSTSDLSTVEFEDYCESIRTWARSYLNFRIPLPNENYDFPDNYFSGLNQEYETA